MDANTQKRRRNSLVLQGSILAAAALIVRIIGFFYRIPLANLLTDEGSGYYSNSFVIYTFFLMITTYGFPAAISKLTSERYAEKKYKEAHNIFTSAVFLGLLLGIVSALVLWFGADKLAALSGSAKSVYAIKALAPALLIFSVLSVFRGYYQGLNTMVPTAVSQIIEQIFNAFFSLLMAWILISKGLEFGAAGGAMGTGIGALAALLVLLFLYYIARDRVINKNIKRDQHILNKKGIFHYWKIILMVSVPMVLGTVIINLTSFVDMLMFQRGLIFQGYTEIDAVKLYGIYNMKHQVLINLPVTIASSLAMASIPSISVSVIQKDYSNTNIKINAALRATLFIVMPAAVGMFVLSDPIIDLLFTGEQLDLAGKLLKIGSISIIFFGLSTVSIGIMQGLGKLKEQIFTSLIALFAKVLFNFILIFVFNFNIYGAVVANILFSVISSFLNMIVIRRYAAFQLDVVRTIFIPGLSSIFMGIFCFIAYYLIGMLSGSNTIATLLSILIGVIVYTIFILKMKGLTEEEIIDFPKGVFILKILKKIRLM